MAKTYGNKALTFVTSTATNNNKQWLLFSEQWLDDIPKELINRYGYNCESALAWCIENIPSIISDRVIMQAGQTVATCGSVTFFAPTEPNFYNDELGWSGWRWDTWNLFQSVDTVYLTGHVLTGGTIRFNTLGGPPQIDCDPNRFDAEWVYIADGSWDAISGLSQKEVKQFLGRGDWDTSVNAVTGITDVEEWFYERVPACIGPAPIPSGAPGGGSFGIPRPSSEDEVPSQENMTTPPLDSLIKLSNHTFQLTNNFGRVPK